MAMTHKDLLRLSQLVSAFVGAIEDRSFCLPQEFRAKPENLSAGMVSVSIDPRQRNADLADMIADTVKAHGGGVITLKC